MKAILEFNLPEEAQEHALATKAGALVSVIYELREYLRRKLRYDYDLLENSRSVYEDVQRELHEIVKAKCVEDVLE